MAFQGRGATSRDRRDVLVNDWEPHNNWAAAPLGTRTRRIRTHNGEHDLKWSKYLQSHNGSQWFINHYFDHFEMIHGWLISNNNPWLVNVKQSSWSLVNWRMVDFDKLLPLDQFGKSLFGTPNWRSWAHLQRWYARKLYHERQVGKTTCQPQNMGYSSSVFLQHLLLGTSLIRPCHVPLMPATPIGATRICHRNSHHVHGDSLHDMATSSTMSAAPAVTAWFCVSLHAAAQDPKVNRPSEITLGCAWGQVDLQLEVMTIHGMTTLWWWMGGSWVTRDIRWGYIMYNAKFHMICMS